MEALSYVRKGLHDVGHQAEKLGINEIEAQSIANWFSSHIEWVKKSVVAIKNSRARLLGQIWPDLRIINLYGYGDGATVGCLLHELAHYGDLPNEDHGRNFKQNYQELLKWWDEFQDEMLPKQFKGDIFRVLDYIMEEIEEGEPLTPLFIGEELKDEGLNTTENFNFCVEFFAEAGFPLVRR